MITLFIDTCSSYLRIAIIKDNQIINQYDEELKTELSIKAISKLQIMMNEINLNPNDIDQILVANGPGSFTGIRIGVTIAKTYAWSLQKKIIPLSSLEIIASTNCNSSYIVPVIDARRNSVYASIYDNNLNSIVENQYITIESLKKLLENYPNHIFISNDIIDSIDSIKPNIDILKIVNKHKNANRINPHSVNPNYLKLTEAEMKLQERKEND